MIHDFPSAFILKGKVLFQNGTCLDLPLEYNKAINQSLLLEFYSKLFENTQSEVKLIGSDPLGFNYIKLGAICYVGLLVQSGGQKSKFNKLKKQYPNHRFNFDYLTKRIAFESKLKNNEEYIPIEIVTQNIHELRGLNSKISQHVDAIMKIDDERVWVEKFEGVEENIKKIYVAGRLMKFILDNTKFYIPNFWETLKMDYNHSFDLGLSIDRIVNIYRNNFKRDKINIEVENRVKRTINGDREYFEILIKILLENAIKYSNDINKIPPKIIVTEQGIKCNVSIKSFGFLIPTDEIPNLFTKGFRARNSSKEGTGMGLYNSKMLAEKFNGKITYSAEEKAVEKDLRVGFNIFTITFSPINSTD